jgi:hypothetical protein
VTYRHRPDRPPHRPHHHIRHSADWPYPWLAEKADPPDRTLVAVWSVLLGVCLSVWLLAAAMAWALWR